MNIEINLDREKKRAFIYIGSNKDIDGEYIESPNGEYFFLSGTLFSNTSETESIVVFTKDDVLYTKKINEYIIDLKLCRVFDDGSCFYCIDEDTFIALDPTGKQKAKRKIVGLSDQSGIIGNLLYAFGCDDDARGILSVLDIYDYTVRKAILPDFKIDEEEFYGSDAIMLFDDTKFLFGYEDNPICLVYDLNCRSIPPTENDKIAISEYLQRLSQKREEEKLRKKKERAEYMIKSINSVQKMDNTEKMSVLKKFFKRKK